MLSKLKRLTIGGLAIIGGLVLGYVAAVVGSAYIQYNGKSNYSEMQRLLEER